MKSRHDELEARLSAMFREQAEGTPVPPVAWDDVRTVAGGPGRSSPRRFLLVAAAVVVAVIATAATVGGRDPARVQVGPATETENATPTSPAPVPPAFHVETRQVSLTADAVAIDAGGKRFHASAPMQVGGDPGIAREYTTLELTWNEHGVEMRLFVYFTSDGRDWWSDEIRTYDGADPGEWITYKGEFFRRPLGSPFVGDFEVTAPDPGVGRLHLSNARLEAFRHSPSCDAATTAFALDPGRSPIVLEGFLSGYGVNVQLLDARSCALVDDQNRYRYVWESRDTSIVTVDTSFQPPELGSRHAELRPQRQGETSVHVTATDPSSGAPVATADIQVVVGDVEPLPPPTVVPVPPGQAPRPPAATAVSADGT